MFIVFSGLPATGKSELARALGRHLGFAVLSVDPIESAMLRAGMEPTYATGLAAYLVVEHLVDSHLTLGQGVIVDAVNDVEVAKEKWRALATRHRENLHVIECVCSNERLHRERLVSRHRRLAPNFPEPTWEDVDRRRREFSPWAEPFLELDAVASVDSNLQRLLAWLAIPQE